jgi:hypothetical protein
VASAFTERLEIGGRSSGHAVAVLVPHIPARRQLDAPIVWEWSWREELDLRQNLPDCGARLTASDSAPSPDRAGMEEREAWGRFVSLSRCPDSRSRWEELTGCSTKLRPRSETSRSFD